MQRLFSWDTRVRSVLFKLLCAQVLAGIVYITWKHVLIVEPFPLTDKQLAFAQRENNEWTDLNGEFFFRLSTAHYLADLQRVLIFATCSNSFYKHMDELEISFQVEMFCRAQIKINTFLVREVYARKFLNNNPTNVELSAHLVLNNTQDFGQGNIKYQRIQYQFITKELLIRPKNGRISTH